MNNFALTRQDTSVMKGIAIMAMLCHHLYGCPPDGADPYIGILVWLGVLGKVCVALFLFCSGYGLAANYKPLSILDDIKFVAKRLVKFYANYWVIFLIFVPISIFVFHRSLTEAYGEDVNIIKCFCLDIIGLQGYNSYNITWWFNQLIIILYLLFPYIYRLIRIQPIVAVILGIMLMRVSGHISFDSVTICFWQLPFVMGIGWKLYEDMFPKVSVWLSKHNYVFAIISIIALALTIVLRMEPIIPHWSGMRIDGFLSCAIALVVISTLRYLPILMKILAFLGKHSINIYMIHTFFNAYWHPEWLHECEWMRLGGSFVVLITICLLVSMAVEFLKEKIRFYELVNIITKHI